MTACSRAAAEDALPPFYLTQPVTPKEHPAQGSTSPPASQAFSFINALYRCDIRFCITSARQTTLRSLINLRILLHLGICLTLILKDRIPSEIRRTSRRDDLPKRPALEKNRLLPRSRAEGECADCECRLICICHEQIIQAFVPQCRKEVFSRCQGTLSDKRPSSSVELRSR